MTHKYCPVMDLQVGLVMSKQPPCVQRRGRAPFKWVWVFWLSSSSFFPLAEGNLLSDYLWWRILDGLSKFCSCVQVQWQEFLPCVSEHKRCRVKHSAAPAAESPTGDSNTRTAEDQKQNNRTVVTPSFAALAQGEAMIVHFQFQSKKTCNLSGYWMIPVTRLTRITAPAWLSFTSDIAATFTM